MTDKELKIKYIKAHDFKTSLTTGVYGGLNANGLINMNCFSDIVTLPDSQMVTVSESGKIIGTPKDEKSSDLVREVTFASLMDVNTAKIVVDWIQSKIKEYELLVNVKK